MLVGFGFLFVSCFKVGCLCISWFLRVALLLLISGTDNGIARPDWLKRPKRKMAPSPHVLLANGNVD